MIIYKINNEYYGLAHAQDSNTGGYIASGSTVLEVIAKLLKNFYN